MKLTSIAILTAACCLAGCTLPSAIPITSTPHAAGITGNWEITLNSTKYGSPFSFGIYLTQTGSTVSGVGSWAGEVFPQYCLPVGPCAGYPFTFLNPNFTGTVSPDGSIVLTSTTSGANPAVFSITASATGSAALGGSFVITQSATATDQGPIAGAMIAPLNGTYAGSLISSVTGKSVGVTTALNQAGPDATGFLDYSGSASLTGVSCIGSAAIPVSGKFLGNQLIINLLPANSPGSAVYLTGTISQDAKTITVSYEIVGCSGDSGSGTLTRQ